MSWSTRVFRPVPIFITAAVFRLVLLLWGRYQDTHSPLKYTDIDYLVFTDASRYISRGASPYDRDTYRYTPLLAWILYPTTFQPSSVWFDFGKIVFALGDLVTGYLLYLMLLSSMATPNTRETTKTRAIKYASIWLLNPMVANISTRGSSEGLLAAMVVGLLWAVLNSHIALAGVLLGLCVHFKIYPFIYAASIYWHLGSTRSSDPGNLSDRLTRLCKVLVNPARLTLGIYALTTFMALNLLMYNM